MKSIIIPVIMSFTFAAGHSQTIEDAKKNIYYTRYETAKNILQTIIARGNASPDSWYWLGEIYLKQQKRDAAMKVFMEGKDYFSNQNYSIREFPLLPIGWAHLLLDSGLTADARIEMDHILKEKKYKDPVALWAISRANIDSKNGDVVWAIELLKKAIKNDKGNPEFYVALGDAYRKIIDGTNAVSYYNKALETDPAFAEALYKEGKIYKSQKNTEVFIDRFRKAYQIDTTYTPVLYELYYYYFYRDVVKAQKFLDAYMKNSEPDPHHAYMQTDLYFVSKKNMEAIKEAEKIIRAEGDHVQPRLYKLIAYSYAALGDSVAALDNINLYFTKQKPSEFVAKDYDLKAKLLEKVSPDKTLAVEWYKKALSAENDKSTRLGYMVTLAEIQKELGNREREAVWREKVYTTKDRPTNLDIYKWGMALYSDENYKKADSVFAIYEEKYTEQIYGYLWRARCNALIDTAMEMGLAIPHYKKLIEVAKKDSVKNKSILLRAYGYLGTYEANVAKNYTASLEFFEKMLQLDPENSEALKYSEIIQQWIEDGKGTK